MSMDEVHERALALAHALEKFNQHLASAMAEVDRSHTQVAPLWNDAMRRDYDRHWIPLEDQMKDYNRRIGPRYLEFLVQRLRHLSSYLHGHGS
ncbi:hypothetical protein DES53_10477 [Roseimicrobium gellanilyticum]|uniref:WXG100 family type VII secretion target n=1 Tax=Roseimicrobium gellanilyticum TaxID=748857 RepID=A0A366HM83_9BACT|nr:hypothetical protein DES53_10477 [Roseimicrobium gellanilyticum]